MMGRKFTDDKIIKALEWCERGIFPKCKEHCPYKKKCRHLTKDTIALLDRYKAENERLEVELKAMRGAANSYKAANYELTYKLECLLCHATGNLLSKRTYPLRTMETAVTDYIEKCCNEAAELARAEAIKEFAERLKKEACCPYVESDMRIVTVDDIDNIVKKMTGEGAAYNGKPKQDS